jgi:hypothetical protein
MLNKFCVKQKLLIYAYIKQNNCHYIPQNSKKENVIFFVCAKTKKSRQFPKLH